jgi:hypothetical protein
MLRPTTALGQFDYCSIIPTQYIPVLKDVVSKVGCNPAVRAAASAAIVQALTPSVAPGTPAQAPWYATIAAVGGPQLIADCICKNMPSTMPPNIPAPAQAWYQNPWVIGAVALGAVTLAIVLSRPKAAAPSAPKASPPPDEEE